MIFALMDVSAMLGCTMRRPNPPDQWMTADAEHLRIIDAPTLSRAYLRGSPHARRLATRPQNLLSGLIKCGCCGSGFVVSGATRDGKVLRRSRMRETGLCNNRVTIPLQEIEDRSRCAIERDLADPAQQNARRPQGLRASGHFAVSVRSSHRSDKV